MARPSSSRGLSRWYLVFASVMLAVAGDATAQTFRVFGPKTYARGNGEPVTVQDTFTVGDPTVPYRLVIHNGGLVDGDSGERVSSSELALNGAIVVGPDNFNQKTALVDKSVTVQSLNRLAVQLRGKPGGVIVLEVLGTDLVPPTLAVTAPTGTVSGGSSIHTIVQYADATSGVDLTTLQIRYDGAVITSSCTVGPVSADCLIPSVTAGTHLVHATLNDKAGNASTAQRSFVATASGSSVPTITNLTTPSTLPIKTSAQLAFDYADADGDIATVELVRTSAFGQESRTIAASHFGISGSSGHVSLLLKAETLAFGANAYTLRLIDQAAQASTLAAFTVTVVGEGTGGAAPRILAFSTAAQWNRPVGASDRLEPNFTIVYEDTDADVERVRVRVTRPNSAPTVADESASSFDIVGSAGTVVKRFFSFRATDPLGIYAVALQLIDRRGNVSGEAVASLQLVSTGGSSPATITGFSPPSGEPGTHVVITGQGLVAGDLASTRVRIGKVEAEVRGGTATTLTIVVPDAAVTAPIVVRTTNGGAVSATPFSVPAHLALTPETPSVVTGKSLQFSAAPYTSGPPGLVWSVDGIDGGNASVGTVTSTGRYTAPMTIPAGGTVYVAARLSSDPSVVTDTDVHIIPPALTPGKARVLASVGGKVESEFGGASVHIPAGALQADTEITVTSLKGPSAPPAATGQEVLAAVTFGPSGTNFNTAVTVTLPLVRYARPGTVLPLYFYDATTNTYQNGGTNAVVDGSGTKATAGISHFSTPALVGTPISCQDASASPPSVTALESSIPLQVGQRVPIRLIGLNLTDITPKLFKGGTPSGEIHLGSFVGAGEQAGILLEITSGASGQYALRLEKGSGCGVFVDVPITPVALPSLIVEPNQTVTDPPDGRYATIHVKAGGTLRITRPSQAFESTGPITIDGVIDASGRTGEGGVGRVCGGISAAEEDPEEICGQATDARDGRGGFGRAEDDDPETFGADAPITGSGGLGAGGRPGGLIDPLALIENLVTFGESVAACALGSVISCAAAVDAAVSAGGNVADALEGPIGADGGGAARFGRGGGGGGGGAISLSFDVVGFEVFLRLTGGGGGAGGQLGNRISLKSPSEINVDGELSAAGGAGGSGSSEGVLQAGIDLILIEPSFNVVDLPAFSGGAGGGGAGGTVRVTSARSVAFSASPHGQATARGGIGGTGAGPSAVGTSGDARFADPFFGGVFDPAQIRNGVLNGNRIALSLFSPGAPDTIPLTVEGPNGQVHTSDAVRDPQTGRHAGQVLLFNGFNVVCAGTCQGMEGVEQMIVLSIFSDGDNDGLSDVDEVALHTNPADPDTDHDGVVDGEEIVRSLNPLHPDSDSDGLRDGEEVARGTNPLVTDTDNDGRIDGAEIANGWDALDPNDPAGTPAFRNFAFTIMSPVKPLTNNKFFGGGASQMAINDLGQVVYWSLDGFFRSDGINPPTFIGPGSHFAGNTPNDRYRLGGLSNSGHVSYLAGNFTGGVPNALADVITSDGLASTTVAAGVQADNVSINTTADVAFAGIWGGVTGVFFASHDGSPIVTLVQNGTVSSGGRPLIGASQVSLSAGSKVVFKAVEDVGDRVSGLFVTDGTTPPIKLIDDGFNPGLPEENQYAGFDRPMIDPAGNVYVWAESYALSDGVLKIPAGGVARWQFFDPFGSVGVLVHPSGNESGLALFEPGSHNALWMSDGALVNNLALSFKRVIGEHDTLGSYSIATVDLGNVSTRRMNTNGQFAFEAELKQGASFYEAIVRGDPAAVTVDDPGDIASPQNAPVWIRITATNTGGGVLTFNAGGTLPPGLVIDPQTGAITGQPAAGTAGQTFNVTITVSNGRLSGTTTFTWRIDP